MPSATRVQMWTYAVLLLLVTIVATLLGSSVAEAVALLSEHNSPPSNLSLLVAGLVFALTTFAYLLMFLIQRQLHPNSQLTWLATDCVVLTFLSIWGFGCAVAFTTRGLLDIGSCPASTAGTCSLTVGAGVLLWICSVLLIVTLAYLVITKTVNHPGREAWARSVLSLTKPEDIKPRDPSSAPPSNRTSTTINQDQLSEPEAVRPFLNIDLIDDDETAESNSPPLLHHAPSLPYSRSGSSTPYSHSKSSLPHSYSKPSIPYSSPGSSRTAATSQASLLNARSYTQNSLPSTIHNHSYGSPVPPLPPLVIDEKRRERSPAYLPNNSSQTYIPSASLRHNLIIQIPQPRNEEEGMIFSAASDVFSVMADNAGSPRSLMSDFPQDPPTQALSLLAEPVSRGPTPHSAATEMWARQAPTYTPPLTSGSQWSTNNAPRPHEKRPQYQSLSSGSTVSAATMGFPPYARRGSPPDPRSDSYAPYVSRYHPGTTDTYGHRPQEEEATLFFNERPPAQRPALFVSSNRPEEEEATLFFDSKPRQPIAEEATLFFNAPRVAAVPSPPSGDEATLFISAPRAPVQPAAQDEATLFFSAPRAPALSAQDEATLFFNAPRPPRPPAQPAQDEATLFVNRKTPNSLRTTNSDEATLFFNAPTIARPPLAAMSPEREKRTPSVSPPRPADDDEATLFFPRR
ncbi:hypothetical protein CcaverHIS002_0602360 [Cutaneotrichosporon cavernicola]|nr:hypothetical protein CcaverHIS002_0602360 [Cutaneotrichosporon cavernicola]BEJ01504.1 hypothetical protein CcaverHIS631_0601860 [Cutaneotrichosporon cavernicola]BEJ09269.1 hypothetical protein CcaverHIS641_0601840 [Cutaneotrichosporon cavernicola]